MLRNGKKLSTMRKLPDLCAVDFDGSQQAVFYKMGDAFWACVKKCLNLKAESNFQ